MAKWYFQRFVGEKLKNNVMTTAKCSCHFICKVVISANYENLLCHKFIQSLLQFMSSSHKKSIWNLSYFIKSPIPNQVKLKLEHETSKMEICNQHRKILSSLHNLAKFMNLWINQQYKAHKVWKTWKSPNEELNMNIMAWILIWAGHKTFWWPTVNFEVSFLMAKW